EKKALHWMKTKLVSSGSYLIALLYARDLWLVGSAVPAADPNKDLRISSGAVTLYVYAIITIDGQKCEDRSAPAHRLDQLFQARKETLNYVKALPEDLKTKVINLAVSLEAKTAAARRDDDLVCRDGMAQIRAGLDHGVKHDAPTPPGQVGKT